MANNFDKLWLQKTNNQVGISRAKQVIQSTGRALPCSVVAVNGSIVTVKFEVNASPLTLPNITIPKAESPWIRMPTQVGDKGFTVPCDVFLGGISGLGSGTATLAPVGNLAALVFVPVSNANSGPVDQNAAQIQGPNGAIIQTTTGTTSKAVLNQSGTTVTYGSNTATVNGSGIALNASQIDLTGTTNIDGNTAVTGNLTVSTGATGTFTSADGKTITVTAGIVTAIV
jgi:hypothetical protein